MTDNSEDLISQSWPKGHQFTVTLKVVEVGKVGMLISMARKGELIAGCTVESVGFFDRQEQVEKQYQRLCELFQQMQEVMRD